MEKTRMQVRTGGQGHVDFYLVDCHNEHQLPEAEGVSIRREWDGYDYEELLEEMFDELSENERLELMKKGFNKRFQGIMTWEGSITYIGEDVVRLTIWDTTTAEKYAILFEAAVINAVENSGGDDDYYDYMPNFVDMYRQFCELAGLNERYNKLAEWIDENEDDYNYYGPSRI